MPGDAGTNRQRWRYHTRRSGGLSRMLFSVSQSAGGFVGGEPWDQRRPILHSCSSRRVEERVSTLPATDNNGGRCRSHGRPICIDVEPEDPRWSRPKPHASNMGREDDDSTASLVGEDAPMGMVRPGGDRGPAGRALGIPAPLDRLRRGELPQVGLPIATEQLWNTFHNCSYGTSVVMQSMLLPDGRKSLKDRLFRLIEP